MRTQLILLAGLSSLLATFTVSCKKDGDINNSTFLGKWKASYGDTVFFYRVNGKNMVMYDVSGSPAVPGSGNYQYTFRDNKLGIKDYLGATLDGFRILNSFKWLNEGSSFEVQGVEWFVFMSSTQTYFTFTKIP